MRQRYRYWGSKGLPLGKIAFSGAEVMALSMFCADTQSCYLLIAHRFFAHCWCIRSIEGVAVKEKKLALIALFNNLSKIDIGYAYFMTTIPISKFVWIILIHQNLCHPK